jgi:hypothetical protein
MNWMRSPSGTSRPASAMATGHVVNAEGQLARRPGGRRFREGQEHVQMSSETRRSRKAFAITLTEDSAMAAAAMTGESSSPKIG